MTIMDARFTDDLPGHWAKVTPDAEALSYMGRSWTWAQWDDRIRRAAGGLQALGVGRGDVVAFLDKNHPACVELSLAAGSLGAANAIVNWRSSADEVEYALADCGAGVLIVGAELMPVVREVLDRLPAVLPVIEVTPEGGDGDEYERWLSASAPVQRPGDVDPEDVCLVMYSPAPRVAPRGSF